MHLLFTFSKSLTLTSPQFSWIKHSGEERIFYFFPFSNLFHSVYKSTRQENHDGFEEFLFWKRCYRQIWDPSK